MLYAAEPSGVSYRFFATAIGKAKNACKSALEKLDLEKLTCREGARPPPRRPVATAARRPQLTLPPTRAAVIEFAKILMAQHDPAKDKPIELELSWVCDATGRQHKLVPPELKAEAVAAAEAARAARDDD